MLFVGLLLAAVTVGSVIYVVYKVARLTISYLKGKIKEHLQNKVGGINQVAITDIESVLEHAKTMTLDDLGSDIQMGDYLEFGIKEDGTLEMEDGKVKVDIIRADEIDDQVRVMMKNAGGAIKVSA